MKQKYITHSVFLLAFLLLANPVLFAKKKKKDKNTSNTATTVLTKKELEQQTIFISGVQSYLLGNSQEAITKFNEVLRMNSKNDAALYELARIAFESGNMDRAISYAQDAIKFNPNNEFYYQYLAEAKGEKKDYEGAAKVYETLIKLKPKEYDYYYDWAYMLSKAGKYKEALDVYNTLENKTGIQEEVILQKQPLFIKLGKVEESVKDIEKLVKLYPTETRYIGLIGEIYQSNKMYDKAIQAYNRILAKDENNAEALLSLAETYRKKGDEKKHDEYITNIFSNRNIDIDTKIMVFIPYIEKMIKDTTLRKEVLDMANMIVASHPGDAKAITARADVLYNSGEKKQAQTEYSKAVRSNSDIPATVWLQLYILDTELEDFDSLIAHTKIGIEKMPDDQFGYFYQAIALQQKKENQAASDILLKAFNVLRENDSKNKNIYAPQLKLQMLTTLGDISYELKNYNRSDSSYEAALEIDPNNATVLNNYAYYLSERDEKLDKAERMSKKSNLLVDNNSAFMDTYAWIMFKLKDFSEALDWIEQALDLPNAKERPDLLNHYGDILYKLGQTDKAVEQWQNSLEKGGDKLSLEIKIKNRKIN